MSHFEAIDKDAIRLIHLMYDAIDKRKLINSTKAENPVNHRSNNTRME